MNVSMKEENIRDFVDFLRKSTPDIRKYLKDTAVLVVTHYDADGLSSAAILAGFLQKIDVAFHIRVLEQLDEESIENIRGLDYDVVIFSDMGSSVRNILTERLRRSRIIIIDHHPVLGGEDRNRGHVYEYNPFLFGLDGSTIASASTIAYLFAKCLEKTCVNLAPLAIVGALGDRQDLGERYSLSGLNEIAVTDAVKNGLVKVEIGLRLFGLQTKPLVTCLENTMDPFLPGLTGNEGACLLFLKRIGVQPVEKSRPRTYSSLSEDEKRRLATELVKYLLSIGYSAKQAESIFGTLYYLVREDPVSPLYDAREYATLLNACGRLERYSLAIALGLGFRGKTLHKAVSEFMKYKKILSEAINRILSEEKYIRHFDHCVFVDARDLIPQKMAGSIASILSSSRMIVAGKPVIVVAGKSKLKISVRKPWNALRRYKNLHLGEILAHATKEAGGFGGGHANAAGGLIPEEKLEEFVESFNKIIGGGGYSKSH